MSIYKFIDLTSWINDDKFFAKDARRQDGLPSWEEAGQKGGSLVGVKRHHTRTGLKGWKGDENRPQEGGRGRVCIIGGRECESGVWVRWGV